mgnify:CR=1 FL=1
MTGQEMRVHVKRNSKKKSGYEVEKREDGFFYGKQRNRVESSWIQYNTLYCYKLFGRDKTIIYGEVIF